MISDKSLNALYLSTSKNCGKIKGEEGKGIILIIRETLTDNRLLLTIGKYVLANNFDGDIDVFWLYLLVIQRKMVRVAKTGS